MPLAGLYAVRHSRPAPEARARASRRRGARPRLSPASRDPRRADAFAAALEGLQPPNEISWRERDAGRRMPITSPGPRSRRRSPARSISARSWCGCATNSRRRHHRQRRRQLLRLGPSLLPVPPVRHPARADLRLDGLRRAGGGRRQARCIPERTVVVLRRRRRFPDERAGIRDRRAIRAAVDRRHRATTASTAPSACTRSANIPAA